MVRINDNFIKLPSSYLFSEVARKVKVFMEAHPEAEVIRMGIGDVTRPLCPIVTDALHKATKSVSSFSTAAGRL